MRGMEGGRVVGASGASAGLGYRRNAAKPHRGAPKCGYTLYGSEAIQRNPGHEVTNAMRSGRSARIPARHLIKGFQTGVNSPQATKPRQETAEVMEGILRRAT
jgi:hypothetical protein